MHAQLLSRFATELRHDELPPAVVESAKRHLLDAIGVGLRGAAERMPGCALEGIAAVPGSQGAVPVWGRDVRLAAPYAAMANGVASHVLDFDDTHTAGIVHGSAILAPVVLALGDELDCSGEQIVAAFVGGWEVAARVGLAAHGSIHQRGYHTTSIAGVFGAAVAAGKLLGLSQEQMAHAIGLAGSQASGINEYQTNGSSAKIVHTGWAAHAGIIAAYLARAGMTGPLTVFEGGMGLLRAYGDPAKVDPAELSADLGERWEMTRVSIKPYPCCHFLHAFIDCARALKARRVQPDDVAEIECVVPEIEIALVCEPVALKRSPMSPYAAKFSLPYAVATALVDGEVGHRTFTEASIGRKSVLELAARVQYRVAAPGETTFPRYFPGWLRVSLRDGSRLEERLDVNWGTPENPLPRETIEQKFRDNARSLLPAEQIERLMAVLWSIERNNLREVGALTVPAVPLRKRA
jgi:2-methylcitrate dehydratase PrpD